MVKYGLTIENRNLIVEKAKTKNNGVYRFRGVVYRVMHRVATHFAVDGQVLQNCGAFNAVVANLKDNFDRTKRDFLKGI